MTPLPFTSEAETAIRIAVVERIRQLVPQARIIHELNVEGGAVRADIAAVTEDRLYLFEIKSARDTLSRLPDQLRYFHPACHGLVVVADEKWCGAATSRGYPNCDAAAMIRYHAPRAELWQWPGSVSSWSLPRATPPWALPMLTLLWANEVRTAAADHRVSHLPRTPAYKLIPTLCDVMTGREISAAVCKALRARSFTWADAPVEFREATE